jgi:hypothetical protein
LSETDTENAYKVGELDSRTLSGIARPPKSRRGRPRRDLDSVREYRTRRRQYDAQYHRTRRRLGLEILRLFEDGTPGSALGTGEIASHVKKADGIGFTEAVIQKEIRNYNIAHGPPHIEEVAAGVYRLTPGNLD